eukprot:751922-Hanusia_phi.AAC.1
MNASCKASQLCPEGTYSSIPFLSNVCASCPVGKTSVAGSQVGASCSKCSHVKAKSFKDVDHCLGICKPGKASTRAMFLAIELSSRLDRIALVKGNLTSSRTLSWAYTSADRACQTFRTDNLAASTTQAPLTSSTPTTTSPVISTTPAPEASPRINVSSPSSNTIVNESNTFIGLPSHLWGVVTAQSSQASFRTSQLISFETGMLQFHGVCDCSTFDSRDWILLNGSTTSDVAACSRQSCSAASSFPYSIRIPVVPPSTAASKLDSFLQADWILNLQSQHVRLSARNKLLKFFITAPSNASNIAQGLVNAVLLNQSSKVVNSASSTFLRLAVHVAESSWSSWEAGAEKFLILELRNSTRASLWWSVAPSFASSWEANPTLSLQDEQQSPHTE